MRFPQVTRPRPLSGPRAFSRADLLIALAVVLVLAACLSGAVTTARSRSQRALCRGNLQEVDRAVLLFAGDHEDKLPANDPTLPGDPWWWYKEQVKRYAGLSGPSSPKDTLFACPCDRGYSDPKPFWQTARFDYGSYVFNGVNLPGVPNVAGWALSSIRQPRRTLLVMEWTAHAPLSWHHSRTGRANAPFYCDAESMLGFADGHVSFAPIYYDGYTAAYTRDPIPGYGYQFSGR
jgi:hypothetical protein